LPTVKFRINLELLWNSAGILEKALEIFVSDELP
jgi:hypothetical protein